LIQWSGSEAELKQKRVIEARRREYNEVRPHSILGQLTPKEFINRLSEKAA